MLDLNLLLKNNSFNPSGQFVRMAFLHHGFKTSQLALMDRGKSRFSPRYPALGLLSVARSVQVDVEKGWIPHLPDMRYFDEDDYACDDMLVEDLKEWLQDADAGYILVGLYTLAFERTAKLLKRIDPSQICIVVGGAHPTVAPAIDCAHIVVRGEGGIPIRHILNKLFSPDFGTGREARGICFQLDGAEIISSPSYDNSLATTPAPAFAYELIHKNGRGLDQLHERWWKAVGRSPQLYICTQSCRARCTFCSTYLVHGKSVSRPIDMIRGDLDYMVDKFGHDALHFQDDDLLQHEQFDDLLDLLASRRITWTCNARSEYMTPTCARQIYDAGCRRVFLGVESMSQKTLDYYRKSCTVEQNSNAVEALDNAKIGVVCGFIVGAPHDTIESSLADIDLVLQLPIYFLSASILTPDIGTVEYLRAKKSMPRLAALGDVGSRINMRPRPELFGTQAPYGMPTVCKALTKDQLNELYELACCEFFLRESVHERIKRLTPIDRTEEVEAWYKWTSERAWRLSLISRVTLVRERASILVSNSKWCKPDLSEQIFS